MKKLFILSLALSIFAACVSTRVAMLNPGMEFEPVPPDQVKLYLSFDDIEDEFIKIATITAEGKEGLTTQQKMYDALRKKAGKIGADAIVLQDISNPSDLDRFADSLSGGLGLGSRQGMAVAIKFKKNIK